MKTEQGQLGLSLLQNTMLTKRYESRFDMEKDVFVDREYNKETECVRSTLRPILKAAKKNP